MLPKFSFVVIRRYSSLFVFSQIWLIRRYLSLFVVIRLRMGGKPCHNALVQLWHNRASLGGESIDVFDLPGVKKSSLLLAGAISSKPKVNLGH